MINPPEVIKAGTLAFQDPIVNWASYILSLDGPVLNIHQPTINNLYFLLAIQDIRHTELILDLTGCLDSTVE